MTNILLMFVLSVIRAQPVALVTLCPASCVVCSEDAIICNGLVHIIEASDTTQALLLTDGSISSVQPASLSDLSNITVIGLSHNHISVLGDHSFRTLPLLHTLLLDHNLLTSQALQGGALTNLTQLEVLALGHNLISMIQGGWLQGNKALRSLKLEGNLLTSLDSDSFPLNDFHDLESLDLSDNLINHLDRDSFDGLVSLQILDLSRNRLSSAPAEAFSYLSWLTNLNLDLNSWNCSCQLLELAAFLSTFIQQPDKTLYNGRRMVCVSADNPAVTTVLELTEANCVPANQNITVQIETKASVTPQQYARDLAITAVICFIGGVGLTLLLVLIYHQVSQRKKLKESKRQKVEEDGSNTLANHNFNHLNISEKRSDLFMQSNSSQPWDRGVMTLDEKSDSHSHWLRPGIEENGSHFWCPDCHTERQKRMGPDLVQWNKRINEGMEAEEEIEKRGMRITEKERRMPGSQQGVLSRDIPNKFLSHGHISSSSHPWNGTFGHRQETLAAHREVREGYKTYMEGKNKAHDALHCRGCHRTYRPSEQSTRQGRIHTNKKDPALFDGYPSQHRDGDQFDMMKNTELRRETRNVTFDLERLRTLEHRNSQDKREEEERTFRDKDRGRVKTHKAKVQSSPLLKVKLNLNPLRKSKVHPRRKIEHGHSEKSSSKNSKDKGQSGKERGDREGKGKSGKKTKGSSEKIKKSTKTKRSTEDGEEEKVKDRGKAGQKSKRTSKSGQEGQESKVGNHAENKPLENSEPGETTNTAEQSASAITVEQGQNFQGGRSQYQGAGLVLGSAQPSLQHPLSLSATNRNHAANMSLLGSSGTRLTGNGLSLQGGNVLLNTMAPGFNALFPSYPANTVAPSVVIRGPNIAPSGTPNNFSRQTEVSFVSPATSILANTFQANPLEPSSIHKSSLHTSQPVEMASSVTANTAVNPATGQHLLHSQLPPDSSPLIAGERSDPVQGPGHQTGRDTQQLPPESQISQTKQSITLPTEASSSADGMTPLTPRPETLAENLSNSNSQTETGHLLVEPTVNMSAGVVAMTEGHAAGVSGDFMQAATVSVSGISAPNMSTQSVPTVLLQQEYLSEEGGSSPRRKLKLVLPEKTSSRPPTALEKKIR